MSQHERQHLFMSGKKMNTYIQLHLAYNARLTFLLQTLFFFRILFLYLPSNVADRGHAVA